MSMTLIGNARHEKVRGVHDEMNVLSDPSICSSRKYERGVMNTTRVVLL